MRAVVRAHVTHEQYRSREHTPHDPDGGRDCDRRHDHRGGEGQQRGAHEQPDEHGRGDLGSA
jgi:hypothetical protein